MHAVVTGAAGFVGSGLVRRLLQDRRWSRLSLIDRAFEPGCAADARVTLHAGDFGDAALLQQVLDAAPGGQEVVVFHLASVPGALAERDPALGLAVNLHATQALILALAGRGRPPARFVFASSVAVYGAVGSGAAVDEDAAPAPRLSYGAHKLMTEVLLADLSRRGDIDARSLRLPGIVARPPADSGHGSAFMSLLLHRAAAGTAYDCPVSPDATAWWMSLPCCVDNLLHAAALDSGAAATPPGRVWQLPLLRLSVRELLLALGRRFGADAVARIRHLPDERIESLFGRLPPMATPRARAAGFVDDRSADALVERGLGRTPQPAARDG